MSKLMCMYIFLKNIEEIMKALERKECATCGGQENPKILKNQEAFRIFFKILKNHYIFTLATGHITLRAVVIT